MHELALVEEVIAICAESCGGARVRRIVLEVGKLSCALPDALRFAFELAGAGTVVEGATLEIVEPQGRARCRVCGAEVLLDGPYGRCGCGAFDLDWVSGDELRIAAMEVD